MIRWDATVALCDHLRAGLLDGGRRRRARDPSWERLFEVAGRHAVTPALAWCLRHRPGLPPMAADYLRQILALNGKRNRSLLDAVAEAAGVLNRIGVEPVLLKGAARLVEGCYPDPALRFLGDLDLLVPEGAARDAFRALQGAGYAGPAVPDAPDGHHHLPMLSRAGVGIELHTAVTDPVGAAAVPTDWFVRGARPFDVGGGRVRLAEATRSVAHVVAHDQLQHGLHSRGLAELRQLLDVALLRRRHGGAIDWAEIDGRFRAAGRGPVLAGYMAVGRLLFGQDAPALASLPAPRAARRFIRACDPAGMRARSCATESIAPASIRRGDGMAWVVVLGPQFCRGDSDDHPDGSALDLWEDGRPLGPAHSLHDAVRNRGAGAFSHWEDALYFSTSDGADPRRSGRVYSFRAPVRAGTCSGGGEPSALRGGP